MRNSFHTLTHLYLSALSTTCNLSILLFILASQTFSFSARFLCLLHLVSPFIFVNFITLHTPVLYLRHFPFLMAYSFTSAIFNGTLILLSVRVSYLLCYSIMAFSSYPIFREHFHFHMIIFSKLCAFLHEISVTYFLFFRRFLIIIIFPNVYSLFVS